MVIRPDGNKFSTVLTQAGKYSDEAVWANVYINKNTRGDTELQHKDVIALDGYINFSKKGKELYINIAALQVSLKRRDKALEEKPNKTGDEDE